MEPSTTSSKATILQWLEQDMKLWFKYPRDSSLRSSGDRIYQQLGESITIEKWNDFTLDNILQLRTLAPYLDKFHNNLTPATLPIIFDGELVLFNEATLQSILGRSLIYNVNMALRWIYVDLRKVDPITIMAHVPFSSEPLKDDVMQRQLTYTPDYSVFQGAIYENLHLMNSTGNAVPVGESRYGIGETFRPADIGQMLWYACRRKTRFAWCISNTELMIIQFTCSRKTRIPEDTGSNDIVGILEGVVTSAMLEREGSLGSRQQIEGSEGAPPDLPLSQRSKLSSTSDQDDYPEDGSAVLTSINTHKRTKSNTSADSETVSPTNRHLQKKARETFTSNMQESSSPSLPSSPPSYPRRMTPSSPSQLTVEDTSPTPEERGTLSSSYEPPSSPYTTNGGLSANKVREISDVAGGFTARVFTLQLGEGNDGEAPLVILGLIALASLAEDTKALRISEKWINLKDFL